MLVGVDPFLDLVGKGLPRSILGSSPIRELVQCVDVGGFILLHAQNVAKELELSQDDRRQQRARASEIVNSRDQN